MNVLGVDAPLSVDSPGPGGALMVSWGPTVPGRDQLVLEVFVQALSYLDAMIAAGRISRRQEYLAMDGNLGANGGFLLVSGTIEQLRWLQAAESWNRLMLAASNVVNGLVLGLYGGGDPESFQTVLDTHLSVQTELGLLGSDQDGSVPIMRLVVEQ